jgi:hypothetical protein
MDRLPGMVVISATIISEADMLTIDKGIPLPPKKKPGGVYVAPIYPLRQMEVGDSFFAAGKRYDQIRPAIRQVTARPGQSQVKFVIRDVEGGVRVWRTA